MLRVEYSGPVDAPCVLFLDGAPTFPERGTELVRRLGERGLRAGYVTYPGTRDEEVLGPERVVEEIHRHIVDYLQVLERPVSLVGYSWGSYHALVLAAGGQVRCASVTLLGGFASTTPQVVESRAGLAQAVLVGADLRDVALGMLSPERQGDPVSTALVRRWIGQMDPQVTAAQLRSLAYMPSLAAQLSNVRVPVTVRVGELDAEFNGAATDELLRGLSKVTHEIAPGCGHFLLIEDVEGTVESIVANVARAQG